MSKKLTSVIFSALVFTSFIAGCNDKSSKINDDSQNNESSVSEITESTSDESSEANNSAPENVPLDYSEFTLDKSTLFSERDLSGEYSKPDAEIILSDNGVTIDGNGISAQGSEILISEAGTYLFRGSLSDGKIIVNTDKQNKVQLVFDGVDISCANSSPLYVESADKVFLTLTENSVNTLSDGKSYTYEEEGQNEPDAVIFSADDLTVNGKGKLIVNANYNEGIASKNEIVIANSTISIKSVGNGIKGKDNVAISSAVIDITSDKDGIKSSDTQQISTGFVYITDSAITVNAQEDGIQAESAVIAEGNNNINIISGGGYTENTDVHNDMMFGGGKGFGGERFNNTQNNQQSDSADSQISRKGIKAKGYINIENGNYEINSCDDALHSNCNINISGGNLNLSSGDDAVNADNELNINGGTVNIATSYEGIEAAFINISGGDTSVTASDDGINASDGTSQGGMGTLSDASVNISGGNLHINAGGDGLDSNGTITVTGGNVYVDGPENNGNAAIDGNGEMLINAGTIIALGSSGMVELPSENSAQNIAVITLEEYCNANTEVKICDNDGKAVIKYKSAKKFNSIITSTPEFENGKEYTVYTDSTEVGSFTVENAISYVGTFNSMGGFGGHHGGGGFGGKFENGQIPPMPDDMPPPDFEGERPDIPDFQGGERPDMPDFQGGERPDMPGRNQQPVQ